MKIEIEVSQEAIVSALFSGTRGGGIRYWATFGVAHETDNPNAIAIIERVTGARHVLDEAAVKRGLELMAKLAPHQLAQVLERRGDQRTGDCLVQCAVLGELRYG